MSEYNTSEYNSLLHRYFDIAILMHPDERTPEVMAECKDIYTKLVQYSIELNIRSPRKFACLKSIYEELPYNSLDDYDDDDEYEWDPYAPDD